MLFTTTRSRRGGLKLRKGKVQMRFSSSNKERKTRKARKARKARKLKSRKLKSRKSPK